MSKLLQQGVAVKTLREKILGCKTMLLDYVCSTKPMNPENQNQLLWNFFNGVMNRYINE